MNFLFVNASLVEAAVAKEEVGQTYRDTVLYAMEGDVQQFCDLLKVLGHCYACRMESGKLIYRRTWIDRSAVSGISSSCLRVRCVGVCHQDERRQAAKLDEEQIALIKSFPPSSEKRVISFGLYGSKGKYVDGAVRNAELAQVNCVVLGHLMCWATSGYRRAS